MKSKKILTVLLASMLVLSSTVSVFASETRSTSKDKKDVSSRNYTKERDNKDANEIKDWNVGRIVSATKAVTAPKVCTDIKQSVPSKDYNLGKDTNFGSAIREAQAKAKAKAIAEEPVKETPVEISQTLKDQIKAEFTAMRETEVANKAIFVSAVNKKNQVVSYIHQVAEGKITYSDAQLTELDSLSATFEADIKAVTDATVSIKTAEAAVKESAKNRDYNAVLAGLKIEAAARVARGAALTKVSQDLDAFLLVLVEGQAVLPVAPVTPVTPEPVVVPAPVVVPEPTTTPAPTTTPETTPTPVAPAQ